MKGSERDSEEVLAKEIKARSNLAGMYLKEPLHSIVGWIGELENKYNLLDKRVVYFEQLASEMISKLKKAGIELKNITRV